MTEEERLALLGSLTCMEAADQFALVGKLPLEDAPLAAAVLERYPRFTPPDVFSARVQGRWHGLELTFMAPFYGGIR